MRVQAQNLRQGDVTRGSGETVLRVSAGLRTPFITCGACGGWIDCRDLGQVFEHERALPHPAQDRPQ